MAKFDVGAFAPKEEVVTLSKAFAAQLVGQIEALEGLVSSLLEAITPFTGQLSPGVSAGIKGQAESYEALIAAPATPAPTAPATPSPAPAVTPATPVAPVSATPATPSPAPQPRERTIREVLKSLW